MLFPFFKAPPPPPPIPAPPTLDYARIVGTAAAILLIAALLSLRRWLRSLNAPFVENAAFPQHLHRPVLGIAELMGDAIEGTRRIAVDSCDESGITTCRLLGSPVVTVLKAEHVRKVLLASNFRGRISLVQKHMDNFLGPNALITLMHGEWKAHRRMMMRAFHWQSLRGMVPEMAQVATAFAALLVERGRDRAKIDIFQALKLATLDTIGLTAFGFAFNTIRDGAHPVAEAFEYLLDETTRRQFEEPLSPSALMTWLPTPSNRRFWREKRVLRRTVDAIVAARIEQTRRGGRDGADGRAAHEDLLQHMTEASEASQLSGQAFADNLLTFLFGGFDTTSIALSYTLFLLAKHPAEQQAVREEVLRVLGADGAPTPDGVSALRRCHAVISEALRLYPPAPLTTRTLEADLDLDGRTIPAGTMMWVPIWWVQRSRLNWGDDAEAFRPDRFLEGDDPSLSSDVGRGEPPSPPPPRPREGGLADHPVADHPHGGGASTAAGTPEPLRAGGAPPSALRSLAFSGGQRNCVGQRFAMLEATVMLAVLVRECSFELAAGHEDVHPVSAGVVQKPRGGIWLHVAPRRPLPT